MLQDQLHADDDDCAFEQDLTISSQPPCNEWDSLAALAYVSAGAAAQMLRKQPKHVAMVQKPWSGPHDPSNGRVDSNYGEVERQPTEQSAPPMVGLPSTSSPSQATPLVPPRAASPPGSSTALTPYVPLAVVQASQVVPGPTRPLPPPGSEDLNSAGVLWPSPLKGDNPKQGHGKRRKMDERLDAAAALPTAIHRSIQISRLCHGSVVRSWGAADVAVGLMCTSGHKMVIPGHDTANESCRTWVCATTVRAWESYRRSSAMDPLLQNFPVWFAAQRGSSSCCCAIVQIKKLPSYAAFSQSKNIGRDAFSKAFYAEHPRPPAPPQPPDSVGADSASSLLIVTIFAPASGPCVHSSTLGPCVHGSTGSPGKCFAVSAHSLR